MTATLTPRTTTRFDQVDLDESGPNGATAPGHTEALDPKPTPRAGGLTLEQSEAFGAAMDELRELIRADLGTEDANYIRRVIAAQRKLEVGGRLALFGWFLPPLWVAGAVSLGLAKIIDNMEIGHNIMHGQYDWMRDDEINSRVWEWDHPSVSTHWKHSHNDEHHTWTNIVGRDRDVGYGTLRMSEDHPWKPVFLLNPVFATLLAINFDHGVALHEIHIEEIQRGRRSFADVKPLLKEIGQKSGKQALKDYVLFPALTGPGFLPVAGANLTANLMRNLWTFLIIFCGHFPDGVEQFPEDIIEGETRGDWYARQILGSANIDGGQLFHLMTGNLSHQIEHHAFPDIPARRYAEMAPRVQELCEEFGLDYHTGGLAKQFGTVVRKIGALALPESFGPKAWYRKVRNR